MDMTNLGRAGIVAFAVSVGATPIVTAALAARQKLDIPNSRSSHSGPVPRGGGLAVILAVLAGTFSFGAPTRTVTALVVAGLSLGVLGAIEDFWGVRAARRLGFQLCVGVITGVLLSRADQAFARPLQVLIVSALVAANCNAVNFMDGINGITSAKSISAGVFFAVYGNMEHVVALQVGGIALAGAFLAFLPFNFPSAKVFLGDSGSYFVGGWIAALAGAGFVNGMNPIVLIAPLSLYLADTLTTVLQRLRRAEPIMDPHRSHAYQRVVQAGWTHTQTTAVVFSLMALHGGLALTVASAAGWLQVSTAVIIIGTLLVYLRLPEIVAASYRVSGPSA